MLPWAFFSAIAHLGLGSNAPQTLPTASVAAVQETQPVGTSNDDAADDPAIWRNPRQPEASLIVATDKKAGLYVYTLSGKPLSFVPAGRVNNVDLIDLGRKGILVVASDRNDEANASLLIYRLDPASGTLHPLGKVAGGAGEAYGVCLVSYKSKIDAYSVLKDGTIHQVRLTLRGSAISGDIVRSLKLPTQTEGCVVDGRSRTVYVGEEGVGIWAFSTDVRMQTGTLIAKADGQMLVADVEGLALYPKGRKQGWLIASSQGDNAYAVFRLPDHKPVGRFRIAADRFGSVEETDGIAVAPGTFGKDYPDGLFVAQDGQNEPAAQNFKLVSWKAIVATMKVKK